MPRLAPPLPLPKAPQVSIIVSDLSSKGSGRWGLASGDRPFLLSRALNQAGISTEIVGFSHEPNSGHQDPHSGLRIIQLRQGISWWKSIHEAIQCLQGNLIYAYKPKPMSYGVALLHRLRYRHPVILDIDDWELSWHGGDQWRYHVSLKQLARDLFKPNGALRNPDHPQYLKWTERLIPWADGITTHTTFLQQRFGGSYVPNGKDTDLFDPDRYNSDQCRSELGLNRYRILMFPGAPRPYKGIEDLLTALDKLNYPDLKLVIVGGSPYDDYDSKLREKWGHHLIQLPQVPYNEIPKYIAAAHIIAIPQQDSITTQAQFPLKITDGMAMAKPILATRVGDIPEILGDTGYIVSPNSPDQLATAIELIFEKYDQAMLKGQQARRRCQQLYSLDAMSKLLYDFVQPWLNNLPKGQTFNHRSIIDH